MEVSGRGPVAALLHSVAEGIESGSIRLGDEALECAPDIVAVVEVPEAAPSAMVTLSLHFGGPAGRSHPLEVEQELTHPGG